MTPIERRTERVEMAIAQAQCHLNRIKESPDVCQGSFLCEASGQIQKAAHDLQSIMLKKWMAGHKSRMAQREAEGGAK